MNGKIKYFFNNHTSICKGNVNEEELYFVIFEIDRNPLYKILDLNNDQTFTSSLIEGKFTLKFNLKQDIIPYESNYQDVITAVIKKHFSDFYIISYNTLSGNFFIEKYNEKMNEIYGFFANVPDVIERLFSLGKIALSNFSVAIENNSKLLI